MNYVVTSASVGALSIVVSTEHSAPSTVPGKWCMLTKYLSNWWMDWYRLTIDSGWNSAFPFPPNTTYASKYLIYNCERFILFNRQAHIQFDLLYVYDKH